MLGLGTSTRIRRGLGQTETVAGPNQCSFGTQPGTIIGSDGKPVDCSSWWTSFTNFDCGACAFGIDTSPKGSQTNPVTGGPGSILPSLSATGSFLTTAGILIVLAIGGILLIEVVKK
jgi:hypothetical protein